MLQAPEGKEHLPCTVSEAHGPKLAQCPQNPALLLAPESERCLYDQMVSVFSTLQVIQKRLPVARICMVFLLIRGLRITTYSVYMYIYIYTGWGKSRFTVIHMATNTIINNNARINCVLCTYKVTIFWPHPVYTHT